MCACVCVYYVCMYPNLCVLALHVCTYVCVSTNVLTFRYIFGMLLYVRMYVFVFFSSQK